MHKRIILIMLLIISFDISQSNAQRGVSLGLGRAYTALARGPEAIYWNPANLALSSSLPGFNINLFAIGFNIGNNAFNMDFYNDYFTGTGQTDAQGNKIGKTLTDSDKNDILDKIPDSGFELKGRGDFSLLAFNYNNYGFSIEGNTRLSACLPKDAFRMLLTDIGQKTYHFNVDGDGFSAAKANFSYGRVIKKNIQRMIFNRVITIKELAVGANLSYIRGIAYGKVIESDVKVIIDNSGFNAPSRVVAREALGGSGFGLDIGAGAVLENGWQVGLVFDNIPAVINWSKEAKESTNTFDLKRQIFLDEFDDIEIDEYREEIDKELESFSQTLPMNFRLGVAKYYKIPLGNVLGNVEIGREYGNMRFSLGGGLKLSFFETYAAYSRAHADNYLSGAIALNFKYFMWNIGVMNRGGITGNSSKAFSLATGLRFGF